MLQLMWQRGRPTKAHYSGWPKRNDTSHHTAPHISPHYGTTHFIFASSVSNVLHDRGAFPRLAMQLRDRTMGVTTAPVRGSPHSRTRSQLEPLSIFISCRITLPPSASRHFCCLNSAFLWVTPASNPPFPITPHQSPGGIFGTPKHSRH